jgi:hypothetical protein
MATYSALENSSFTDLVVPFTTFNGIDQVASDTQTEPVTGYTLNVTKFTFTPRLSTLGNTGFGVSLDKLIWDFGDGTHAMGYSVEKRYEYPGDYRVTTIFTDQNGVTHRNSKFQDIKVYNYVPDALQWYTPNIAYPNGGLPEKCWSGRPSDDLTIFRYNSWQSWPNVSGDGGYYINLYAQGSKSMPLTEERYWKAPDIHFTPTWRFVASKNDTVPLERAQTTNNTMIYVKLQDGVITHTTEDDPDGELAGTSGTMTVNYIDDNPNRMLSRRPDPKGNNFPAKYENENFSDPEYELYGLKYEDKDIILFASFDSSRFPVREYDKELAGFETLKQDYFQIYETQKVGLPIIVKLNEPNKLRITSNGVNGFTISRNKYFNSPISVCVQVTDREQFPINTTEIVELSSQWSAKSQHFSAGDISTDVLTGQGFVSLYLSGEDTTFSRLVTSISPMEDFKFWDPGKFLAENPVNSYIKIDVAERLPDGSPNASGRDLYKKPYKFTNNVVTVLPKHLTDATLQGLNTMLDGGVMSELRTVARYWETKLGDTIYGTLNTDTTYRQPGTFSLDQKSVDIDADTSGSYSAMVSIQTEEPVTEEKNYRIVAETLIDPPLYFNYDVLYYYMCNPSFDIFHQIKPVYYRNYTYGEDGFTQTYTSPLTTITPGNSGLYGFAVEPLGDVIMVDGDTDKIIRHWRNNEARVEIPVHTLVPDVSADHYPANEDQYGYSPSSVSIDSKLNYWVTLYDAVSTIKIDGRTNEVIGVAIPPVENLVTDGRNVTPQEYWTEDSEYGSTGVGVTAQGEYGENLLKPTAVETCKNDDIIVSYSNPLCSFLARYDQDGNFLYKCDCEGEHLYFPGDICVDVSDHVWAVTESTGLMQDGYPDVGLALGEIRSYNEQLEFRLNVTSVSGAEYTDIQTPVPSVPTTVEFTMLMNTIWDYELNEAVTDGFVIGEFGPNDVNPPLTMYEDNTYVFDNKFFNRGQHPLVFREIDFEATGEITEDTTIDEIVIDEDGLITELTEGYDTAVVSVTISATSPDFFVLQDANFPQNKILIRTVKKPIYIPREGDTFNAINNPSYVIPDCNNNIWFSWGRRFVSRYNVIDDVVDTTVAIGSAYYDPRYDNIDETKHDRRDNADRRSAIEGLSMDTANNLLVINNADKKLYAIYSDFVPASAYVNIPNKDIPYSEFSWMENVSSETEATEQDFLTPDSYLTDEQIKVFLANAQNTRQVELDTTERQLAADQYIKTMAGENGDIVFRTSHGAPGLYDAGLESEIRAGGDWTGFKWINKYDKRLVYSDETTGAVSLTGASDEFTLLPQTGMYDITKINEDKDFAGVIREYIRQPNLRSKTYFYETFLDTIFGTTASSPLSLGKRIYEKISNFAMNHSDIDKCTLQSLISLADMTNYKLTEFGTALPAELERVVDILSVKYTTLKGTTTNYQTDFEKYGSPEQKTIGVNLGSELMFIYDYDSSRSYSPTDFVRVGDQYYQAVAYVPIGEAPSGTDTTEYWKHWPDGHVRAQHMDDIRRVLAPYIKNGTKYSGSEVNEEFIQELYHNQVILIKLLDRVLIEMNKQYVLKEESSGEYQLVTGIAQSWLEQREFKVDLTDGEYIIGNPVSADQAAFDTTRRHNEIVSDIGVDIPLITISDDIITVCSSVEHVNPTLILYRGRTYFFDVDALGHGVEIVDGLGEDAQRLPGGYIGGQGKELGRIIIQTSDDDIHGPIPETIYYRSMNDHTKSGMIIVKDVTDVKHYSTLYNGVTAFNMDISFNTREQLQRLGWGVNIPDGENTWQYYSLYEYIPGANKEQEYVSNVIQWPELNPEVNITENDTRGQTTIEFDDIQEFQQWGKDDGIADIIIEKTIREGLSLFDGLDPLDDHYK